MLGSIISGIGSIAGGLFGANSAAKDRKMQKQFAQNSVQWRAKDAKKAGLHPLATMGYSGSSYTPVGDGGMGTAVSQAANHIGDGINAAPKNKLQAQLGQSSMAVDAANIDLLKAQKLQIVENIRKSAQGAVGTQGGLPSPSKKPPVGSTIKVKLEDGTIIDYPNPDLGMDLGELATYLGATYYGEARTKVNSFLNPKKKPLEVTIPGHMAKGK